MTRNAALSLLGVVQYERRPAASDIESKALTDSPESESIESKQSSKATRKELVKELTSALKDLDVPPQDSLPEQPVQPENNQAASSNDTNSASESGSERTFELLFWRCGSLLVLESSDGEHALTDTKHRLANNILRTVSSSGAGVAMRNTTWPIEGLPGSDKDAEQWLRVFLKGQLNQDPETKVWMMGEDLVELVLSKHGSLSELVGLRLQDNQTGLEVLVTDSLGEMIRKPFLKATAWKTLKQLLD